MAQLAWPCKHLGNEHICRRERIKQVSKEGMGFLCMLKQKTEQLTAAYEYGTDTWT